MKFSISTLDTWYFKADISDLYQSCKRKMSLKSGEQWVKILPLTSMQRFNKSFQCPHMEF